MPSSIFKGTKNRDHLAGHGFVDDRTIDITGNEKVIAESLSEERHVDKPNTYQLKFLTLNEVQWSGGEIELPSIRPDLHFRKQEVVMPRPSRRVSELLQDEPSWGYH